MNKDLKELIFVLRQFFKQNIKTNAEIDSDSIVKYDLFYFALYLATLDGIIESREVKIINYLFDTNFSSDEIIDMVNDTDILDEEFEDTLPISVEFAVNFDNKTRNKQPISQWLLHAFTGVAMEIVEEEYKLVSYLEMIEAYLDENLLV